MTTVVEVKKNANESNMNLVRRFSRKVQEAGIIQKVKGHRYSGRKQSRLAIKESALKKIARKKEVERLFKLGKEIKSGRKR